MSTSVETIHTELAWTTRVDAAPVSVSAGGDLIAVGGAGGTVWVLDTDTGTASEILRLPDGLLRVAASPTGDALAATGPGGYALWRRVQGQASHARSGAWSAATAWGRAVRSR